MYHGTELRVGRAGTLKVSWDSKDGEYILLLSKFRKKVRLSACIDSYTI